MIEPEPDKPTAAHPRSLPFQFGTGFWIFLAVLAVVIGVVTMYLGTIREGRKVIEAPVEAAVKLIEQIRPTITTTTFTQWRDLSVKPNRGNILEIATAEATESFSRTKNLTLFDRVLPGSTSVFEISVPATYRYHIDLDGEWKLSTDGSRVIVRAPRVEPSLPVAFDTAGMRKMTSAGWARWDLQEDLDALEKEISARLAERASAPESIAKIEDEARLAVARFVRTWLLSGNAWGGQAFTEIVVFFEGEEETPDVLPPMLRVESPVPVLP